MTSARSPHRHRRVTTPTVLQMEAMECGAAALGIVLGYYRRFVSLPELRRICGVSRDGVRASQIVHAAEKFGLQAKALQVDAKQALDLAPPFVAFWNRNHFVVVEGTKRDRVFLNDPAEGRRTVSFDEFAASFSHVALELTPGPDFSRGGHRSTVIPSLLRWSRGSRRAIFLVGAISLLLVVPTIFMSAVLKVFIDEVLIRKFDTWLFPLLLGLTLAGLLSAALTWFQQSVLLRLKIKFSVTITTSFVWHLLRLPVLFFTQRYSGDLIARLQSANFVGNLLAGPMPMAVVSVISVIAYTAVMAIFSIELTLIALAMTLINLIAIARVQRRLRDLNASLLNTSAKITGAAMAGLQSMETLKATGSEGDFFGIWSGYQTNAVNASQRLNRISTLFMAMPTFLSASTTAAVLGAGAWLIINGNLSIGGIIAFQLILSNFIGPVHQLIGFNSQMQKATGHVNRLNDVFGTPPDVLLAAQAGTDGGDENAASGNDILTGRIELREVSFAFSAADPPVIENVSLAIEPGERIGLVGHSGSGKSTLLRLILGLYQPTQGEVLYDGKPLADIDRQTMISAVGWVDQDSRLFEGTVLENLTLWDHTAPFSSVVQGARDACIHATIMARVGGYSARVQEGGSNFSGGQQQRLEIARALARQPTVLVLDEATSALDSNTEAQIVGNVLRRGITSLTVAHRLSTIRDCETIYVLQDGKIVESGGHRSLLRSKGVYAELVSSR